MSETLTSYITTVAILVALACFVPCIEMLAARRLRPFKQGKKEAPSAKPESIDGFHKAV